jgi:ribosomal protein L37AE/L43A
LAADKTLISDEELSKRVIALSGDEIDEAFEKLLGHSSEDRAPEIECPKCESNDVDRSRGYRGEYICRNCGHKWKSS